MPEDMEGNIPVEPEIPKPAVGDPSELPGAPSFQPRLHGPVSATPGIGDLKPSQSETAKQKDPDEDVPERFTTAFEIDDDT